MSIEIRRAQGFTIAVNEVIDDPQLSSKAILAYIALARHANGDRKCWPSWERLTQIARMGRTALNQALQELREHGYLGWQRTGRSNVFTLTLPARSSPDELQKSATRTQNNTNEQEETSLAASTDVPSVATDKPSKPDPRIKELIVYYIDVFKRVRGFAPIVNWPMWAKIFQRLLRDSSANTIRAVIDHFFAYEKRTRFGIHDFERNYDNVYGHLLDQQHAREKQYAP